jgi:hypothetical protein
MGDRELHELDREGVVDEDLEDGAVLEADEERLALVEAADNLDVADHVLDGPLAPLRAGGWS